MLKHIIKSMLSTEPTEPTLNSLLEPFLSEPFRRGNRLQYRSESTKRKYRTKLKSFLETYGHLKPDEITGELLLKWFGRLRQRYSEGHCSIHRSCHVAFGNYYSRHRADGFNPAAPLPYFDDSPAQIAAPSPEEIDRLIDTCIRLSQSRHIRSIQCAAIVAIGTCGGRRSNIKSLRYSDVLSIMFQPQFVGESWRYVFPSSGKEKMPLVMDDERGLCVIEWLRVRPKCAHDMLFVNLNSIENITRGDEYLEPLGDGGYQHCRKFVCDQAGLPLISFQDMRVFVATRVSEITGSEERAGKVLGHSPRSGGKVVNRHYNAKRNEQLIADALSVYEHRRRALTANGSKT